MSEQYQVSARRYRPKTFAEVIGQESLAATLKGSISSGRLAHAYLFCGPRGVGKTSCARIFAKTINCLSPTPEGEACGQCESCRAIDKGNSFNLMELDAASNNSVDNIRALTDQVNVPPQVGKYRVFIIDEVHMLTAQAFNAFLKTLEEPPAYVIFILATTEKHKVIPTILSRCQIYDFKRITINDIVNHLAGIAGQQGFKADRRALGVIARKADGAMRDALSIFDQVASSTGGQLDYDRVVAHLNVLDYEYFFRLIDCFAQGDVPGALLLYKEIRDRGFDSLFFINSMAQHVRDLMVAADPRTVSLLETPDDVSARLVEQARTLPLQWYYAAMKILNDCDLNYRTSSNKQLLVELALIRLCQLTKPAQPPFDVADRPAPLRSLTEGKAPVQSQPSPATREPNPQPVQSRPQPVQTRPQPQTLQSRPVTSPEPQVRPAEKTVKRRPGSHVNLNFGETQATVSTLERRRRAFTDDELIEAWNAYIVTIPSQQLLTTAMRNAKPQRLSENEYLVLVDNPMQEQAFNGAMTKLLEFLRNRLDNDFLTIRAELNPNAKVVKHLPPQEFLKKVVDGNPQLGDFLKSLDIEIV